MLKLPFYRLHRLALFSIIPLLLAGCDPVHYVGRSVTISRPLQEATVTSAIKAVPGTVLEPAREIPPSTEWRPFFPAEHNRGGRAYPFHSADAAGFVAVTHTQAKGWMLRVYSAWLGMRPTPEELRKSRALDDEVYLILRQRDPQLPPLDQAKEDTSER